MKVAVVTGTRADYGLLRPTIAALGDAPDFTPALVVTAMHLRADFGATVAEIEADGFAIAARVPAGAAFESRGDFARHLGRAVVDFTGALERLAPDLMLVLGDRFEILAAALAATGLGIPIAHLHGGELSEGSLDDAMRHCVTKLSHLHFVAARVYGERVCQLGEDPARVHVVGAAGLETIVTVPRVDRQTLIDSLGLERLEPPVVVLTLHPTSLHPEEAGAEAEAVTVALDVALEGTGTVVLTLPNDDPGHAVTREALLDWASVRPHVHPFTSLGHRRYLNLLAHADAMVGNSSSGLLETPSFGLPTVNVGERQSGRLKAPNVIDAPTDTAAIAAAVRRALSPAFRASVTGLESPFGDGCVSSRVLDILRGVTDTGALRVKRFRDLPDGPWRAGLELGTP